MGPLLRISLYGVFLSALLSVSMCLAGAQTAAVPRKEAFTLKAYHGKQRAAERVRLAVPADYAHPGRTFDIVFYRLVASTATANPPLVFLMGGPGVPASVIAPIPPYFELFNRLAQTADVILLDQRGLGESTPKVDCPAPAKPIPADLFESSARLLAVFESVYSECAEHWKPQAKATDFAIEQVADDVERIRLALGVKQVDLLGFSYGTRIALEVLRRHPGSVRRAVLQGVLGVDKTVRMPSVEDKIFRTVASLADEQAKAKGLDPSLEQTLRAVREQVSRSPLQVSITTVSGDKKQLRMTRPIFDVIVAGRLGDRNLPALLSATKRGDSALFSQVAQSLYQDIEKGAGSLMARSINCSTSAPVALRRQAGREGRSSLMGEPFDNLMQTESFCRGMGFTPLPAHQPAVRSEIPTLFISGSLDDRTPPAYAEDVRRGFPRGEHVIVKNGGHELLPEPKIQDLVAAFFQDQPRSAAIELDKPEFGTIEEAKRPPRRPR